MVLASQNLSSPVLVASKQKLAVIGDQTEPGSIYIWCSNASGIAFVSYLHIRLENLNFVGCAARWDFDFKRSYHFVEYTGVYFYEGSDVQISSCTFSSGNGTGVIMYDVIGNNFISGSNFIGNKVGSDKTNMTSGGVLIIREAPGIKNVSYSIENCHFTGNENYANRSNHGLGGGVTFNHAAFNSTSHVVVFDSYFTRNHGLSGGGIHVDCSGSASTVLVSVNSSHFLKNSASKGGGGLYLWQSDGSCSLVLTGSFFCNNSADWGGGLAVYNANASKISVQAIKSYWTANVATSGGFAVGAYAEAHDEGRPNQASVWLLNIDFLSCTFRSNQYSRNTLASVGAVHMEGCRSEFRDSQFLYTSGTAVYLLDYSYAVFSGNTSFDYNTKAIQGGAIYITKYALIAFNTGPAPVFLRFLNNSAIVEGGAIYSEATEKTNNECVFESLDSFLNSSGNVHVDFSYNLANDEDRAIFVGSPEKCTSTSENLLFDEMVFSYHPNKTSQVASTASKIILHSKPNAINGYLQIMLGERFYLLPNATDMFGNSAYTAGNLELIQNKRAHFKLVGPTFMGMDSFTRNNELHISRNKSVTTPEYVTLHFIYSKYSTYHKGDVSLKIQLVGCKIGFVHNESTGICQCKPKASDLGNLICPAPRSFVCVRYGYWYDQHNQTGGEPVECPWLNCKYDDGKCPNVPCPDYPGFCRLESENDLCREGRNGLLCSSCLQNYSFSFGAISCVSTGTCPPHITALITLGIVAYWIVFVIFVLFILSVNLSIGSGFMYGIIYYFSIQSLFTESRVTEYFLMVLIDTCVALTQLSPRMFGNIPVCFTPSWDLNLHHKLFHFASPVFVITVIVLVILASRYCRCPRSISLAENSPIHAICMLTLFSYTSMVYTIFYILKPIKIKGEMRVFLDPHLRYFHEDHLPYAMVALVCEFLLVLPVCILLLSAPWLSQRVNLVRLRLKPILDEFQACYHPRYRWFAGFYFLARQLVFLAYVLPLEEGYNRTLLCCANALILIVHATFQPYKSKWLNLLDNILLVDLFLLSYFQLEWGSNFLHRAIPYLLILPPSIYLISVVLLILLNRLLHCLQSTKFYRNAKWQHRCTELPSKVHSAYPTTYSSVGADEESTSSNKLDSYERPEASFFKDYGEREPLLADTDRRPFGSTKRPAFTQTVLGKFATN
jgi:predicted outer membrane repeat protein